MATSKALIASEKPARKKRTRKAVRGETPQERLVDAAIKLFAQHGYGAVSTGMVASRAGLTQSMVHYYFGSKIGLWKASVDHIMRRRGSAFTVHEFATMTEIDPLNRLKIMIKSFVRANAVEPDFNRIMIHEGFQHTPRLTWLIERYLRSGYELFDVTFQQAIDAGQIRPLPVRDLTSIIIGACSLVFSISSHIEEVYGDPPDSPKFLNSLSETITQMVFRGIEPR